jgi:ketosteroid isomerase-like protein
MAISKQQRGEIERLEKAFWQSMVDGEPEVAVDMLTEPAIMVSGHGAQKFDHAGYTKMANDDRYKLVGYRLSDMDVLFPKDDVAIASYRVNQKMEMEGKPVEQDVYDTSTWIKVGDQWRCVAHTESELSTRQ